MWNSKDVYYISDSTAILAEETGQALLCQFPEISFNTEKIPFVKSQADADKALRHILEQSGGRFPLVFCTIMDEVLRKFFDSPQVIYFDIFGNFIQQLETCLETKALREPGFLRQIDDARHTKRVEAIHFSIEHDDGTRTREYDEAEIILLGISRSGKTPVSVYLASHMGLKAANFPLTEDQLNSYTLPTDIIRNLNNVIGITTSPQLLHKIREKRYSGSNYAKLSTCTNELNQAQQIFMKFGIAVVHTEGKSIEETAVQVTQLAGISKKQRRTIY